MTHQTAALSVSTVFPRQIDKDKLAVESLSQLLLPANDRHSTSMLVTPLRFFCCKWRNVFAVSRAIESYRGVLGVGCQWDYGNIDNGALTLSRCRNKLEMI